MSSLVDCLVVVPRVETADLIDTQDVARLLGLSHRNSVTTYLRRYADMPRPIVDIPKSRTRLWLRQDVEAWVRGRAHARKR